MQCSWAKFGRLRPGLLRHPVAYEADQFLRRKRLLANDRVQSFILFSDIRHATDDHHGRVGVDAAELSNKVGSARARSLSAVVAIETWNPAPRRIVSRTRSCIGLSSIRRTWFTPTGSNLG